MSVEAQVLRTAVAALNRGDVDGYQAAFAPTTRRWVAGLDEPLLLEDDSSTLRELHQALEPFELREEGLLSEGRFVCARWCLTGRHVQAFMGVAATGAEISYRTCEFYEVVEGLVIETWVYGDPAGLFRQMAGLTGAAS